MDSQTKIKIDSVCAQTGIRLNDKQAEYACDFSKPVISFSSPGTGKTHSTVAGLIMAQTKLGISGSKINVMSFTKVATAEIKSRYDEGCRNAHITPSVQFKTFHSICYGILKKRVSRLKIVDNIDYNNDLDYIKGRLAFYGSDTEDMYHVKDVLLTINKLNSSLTFDPQNISKKYDFIKLNEELEVFQNVRRDWFVRGLNSGKILRADIPLYALYVLLTNPEIRSFYRRQFDVMVVDEFQDFTLVYLKILSLITGNLIAIGDMKQQIYAFNGSSPRIVEEYLKIYPDAKIVNLTQSYRCKNNIAEFSTNIIERNAESRESVSFEGISDGGNVVFIPTSDLNIVSIVSQLKKEQDKLESGLFSENEKKKNVMFLYRNNFTAIPVIDELYRQGVDFRTNRFIKVTDVPTYKERTILIEAALNPKDIEKVEKAIKLFPEFKKYNSSLEGNPIVEAMKVTGKDLFELNYEYQQESSIEILYAMKRVAKYVSSRSKASEVYASLFSVYDKYVIEGKWWKLDAKPSFYDNLVSSILCRKDYETMVIEETDKANKNASCSLVGVGIRCYTVHVGKGLEADDVYLLDADADIFPGKKQIDKLINAGCELEAAELIRSERNLLYVAATRAKEQLVISYNSNVTPLIDKPLLNEYTYLDDIYSANVQDYDDLKYFLKLFRAGNEELEKGDLSHTVEQKSFESSQASDMDFSNM